MQATCSFCASQRNVIEHRADDSQWLDHSIHLASAKGSSLMGSIAALAPRDTVSRSQWRVALLPLDSGPGKIASIDGLSAIAALAPCGLRGGAVALCGIPLLQPVPLASAHPDGRRSACPSRAGAPVRIAMLAAVDCFMAIPVAYLSYQLIERLFLA